MRADYWTQPGLHKDSKHYISLALVKVIDLMGHSVNLHVQCAAAFACAGVFKKKKTRAPRVPSLKRQLLVVIFSSENGKRKWRHVVCSRMMSRIRPALIHFIQVSCMANRTDSLRQVRTDSRSACFLPSSYNLENVATCFLARSCSHWVTGWSFYRSC